MKCPYCRKGRTRVVDSRLATRGFAIRRRRVCSRCRKRFTTYERLVETSMLVVKRDGTRELFDRDKLKSGLKLACNKRPVSDRRIENVIDKIQRDVTREYESEVPSQALGEMVLRELQRLDKVAYVRFASVYRGFSDVEQFIRESRALKKK